MIPGSPYAVEEAARALRRRAKADRPRRSRSSDFTPPDWPRSRGPTPNPRHPDD